MCVRGNAVRHTVVCLEVGEGSFEKPTVTRRFDLSSDKLPHLKVARILKHKVSEYLLQNSLDAFSKASTLWAEPGGRAV
jgi:hypothetical protein